MKYIISLFIWSVSIVCNIVAQPFYLKGAITKCPYKTAYLSHYRGDMSILIDSTKADASGAVYFILKENYVPGLYTVSFPETPGLNQKIINLIYDRENIEFNCDFEQLPASINILKSDKNKLYYNFLSLKNRTVRQLFALSDITGAFPPGDPFYGSIEKQFNLLQKQQAGFLIDVARKYPGSFLYMVLKSVSFPSFPFSVSPEQRNKYLREHFLDNINFSDTLLLNSNIFTSNAFSYLQLYKNPNLSNKAQECEYISAIDTLMKRCSADPKVKTQVTDYPGQRV